MKDQSEKDQKKNRPEPGSTDRQAIDKAPGEERDKAEKLTERDLKGKKIDADPSREEGRPTAQ